MAAQVRGYREAGAAAIGRTTAPIGAPPPPTTMKATTKERRLKLERRNGSQSLCSSSSELQDSSSSSSSSQPSSLSPSSSSTLSLASSPPYTNIKSISNNTNSNSNYNQNQNQKQHSRTASSPQEAAKQSQPPTWRRSSYQLASGIRSSAATATDLPSNISGRGSLSSACNTSSSGSGSNHTSRTSSRKLAAPPITAASRQLQRTPAAAAAAASAQQRSSAIHSRRARSSAITNTADRNSSRHLQLRYGSLSSIPSQIQSQSNRANTASPQHSSHHYIGLSSSLLKRIDVRGQRHLLRGRQQAAQALQPPQRHSQSQVRRLTARSSSVQQLRIRPTSCSSSSSSSFLASSAAAAADATVASIAAAKQPQPVSAAATNSRLRQAALYARRHSHITPKAAAAAAATPTKLPATANRCPLSITSSDSRVSSTIRQQRRTATTAQPTTTTTTESSSSSSPRVSSRRISIQHLDSNTSRTSSLPFGRLSQSQRKISSSAFSLASSPTSPLWLQQQQQQLQQQQQHHHQQRLEAAKRVKAANDSRVARDRLKVLESRRRTLSAAATPATQLKHSPISTKSTWRSNLLHQPQQQQQQARLAAPAFKQTPSAKKMTTALVASSRYAAGQQQLIQHRQQTPATGKKSGDRSDGRSSSSSSDSASDDSSGSSGDASECSNDENVQPPATRNHLPARANSDAEIDDANGHDKQQVEEDINSNESTQLAEIQEIAGVNKQEQLAAVDTTTPTLAVEAALAPAKVSATATASTTPTTITTTDQPFVDVAGAAAAAEMVDSSCCQTLAIKESDPKILAPRDFSLNIVQNNNNNNNIINNIGQQQQQEETITKRPLSDTEDSCDGDNNHKNGKKDADMTNVKIKIQRKLSIAPDVPIKTEPICLYYDLETRPFARGKFAQVKRCISKSSKLCFAAKCIKKRRRLVDIRHEILLEIEALKLSHHTDHIVKLYEVFETPTEMILILEMANGGELQRVIDDEEAIDEKLVKRMIRQILEGLVQLHDNDIAHLDIKPQNLLLTEPFPGGDVKLCDFGISRRITKDCEVREICGTPDYVAPEILRYDPISLATDMWSLGVLTYVLLTGYSPFGSENRQQTFCNITQATLDFPSEIFYKISEDAVDFMQKLIVREPSERLTSQQARNHQWLCQ